MWDNLGITQNVNSDMYYVFDPVSVKKDTSICLDKQGAVRYLYTKMMGWRMKVSFIERARSVYYVLCSIKKMHPSIVPYNALQ